MAKSKSTRGSRRKTADQSGKSTPSSGSKKRGRPKKSDSTRTRRTTRKTAKPAVEDASSEEAELEESLRQELETARGSTERAIIEARLAVLAIASEKTTVTRIAQAELDETGPAQHRAPAEDERRCSRDMFAFFRDSYKKSVPEDPFKAWRKLHGHPVHDLAAGLTAEDLYAVETRLQAVLSPSYWDFCLEWGSGQLFISPWRETRFVAAGDLLKEAKSTLGDAITRPYLPFLHLSPCDYLALNTGESNDQGESPVVWWTLETGKPEVVVASSFAEWLERFVGSGGDCYWLADDFGA